jgi:spermidine synthase
LPIVLAAISGFTALGYEVIWTRSLLPYLGTTTYTFTTMLTTFLVGIAVGSAAVTRFLRGRRRWLLWIGSAQAILTLSILLSVPGLELAANRHTEQILATGATWGDVVRSRFLIAAMTMAIPTLAMGATFPLIVKLTLSRFHAAPRQLGTVYAINTVAAIIGSAVAGFALIPALGPSAGMALLSAINGGTAAYLMARSVLRNRIWIQYALAMILAVGVPIGVARAMATTVRAGMESLLGPHAELVYYREGLDANVAVSQNLDGRRWLWVNGDQVATSNWGFTCHQIMGHLPMLFAPDDSRALIIGLGTGITANAVAMHPVEETVIAEISDAVVEAATYFADDNGRVYEQDHVRMVLDDGRNYLLTTRDRFDVITAEPLHPWKAGVSNLYSLDFYDLCLQRLTDSYVICQWIPLYGLSSQDVRILTRAFADAFPHTTFWVFGVDALLIGTPHELTTTVEELESRLTRTSVKEDLEAMNVHSAWDVLGAFVMDETAVADYVRGVDPLTDANPIVEYTGPKSNITSRYSTDVFRDLLPYKTSARAILRSDVPAELNHADRLHEAWPWLVKGVMAVSSYRYPEAIPHLERAIEIAPDFSEPRFHLSRALYVDAQNRRSRLTPDQLRVIWTRALTLEPSTLPMIWAMADLEEDQGDLSAARRWWQTYLDKARPNAKATEDAQSRLHRIEQALQESPR